MHGDPSDLLVWTNFGRDTLTIRGSDRGVFLHNLCTNDIHGREVGSTCEAFFTSAQGRILGHGLICLHPDQATVVLSRGQAAPLQRHLEKYVIREDVEVVDTTDQVGYALVSGERAAEWIRTHFGPAVADRCDKESPASEERDIRIIPNCPYLPLPSFLVQYPNELRSAIAAIHVRSLGAQPMTGEAFEMLRIRAGWPEYGTDIDDRTLPQEVGRDAWAIHFRKGCYLGQETVARIDALGHVNQVLRGVVLEPPFTLSPGSEIRPADRCVGRCTSASVDASTGRTYALVYLRRDFLDSDAADYFSRQSAQVVALPFPDARGDDAA